MSDIRLNRTTHDIDLTNLSMSLTAETQGESIAQRLKIRLWAFRGEWFYNTDLGVPYFQSVLVKNATKESVDEIFKDEILKCPGVLSIKKYSSDFDRVNRAFKIDFTVQTLDGPVDTTVLI